MVTSLRGQALEASVRCYIKQSIEIPKIAKKSSMERVLRIKRFTAAEYRIAAQRIYRNVRNAWWNNVKQG